jgi:hypothetical protein
VSMEPRRKSQARFDCDRGGMGVAESEVVVAGIMI